ncbi:tRNA-splicing endonuclease subunit Sen15p [[Candida] railenensis]|uniref:tRNA-splicing endonuclease subunit Sen15p n=1 Tax=[Candida] railenensis TaxID=45579 RepID=A0A9P0QMU8_9ASCO|nr:tRNA-splicing endonuclease subunit Sen15p [[Candida] railenensis]
MTLIKKVKENLIHYNLWKSVQEHDSKVLSGFPPSKLIIDDEDNQEEWVVPKLMTDKDFSIEEIESWFVQIEKISTKRPARITIGLVNDDATIVYYFIHDGIVKPRQN